jgi:prolyl oligopeptidase
MRLKLFAILAALPAIPVIIHAAPPPPAEVQPVKETLHGVEIVDPYRWLEGSAGLETPDAALDARVAAWTDAQNAYGRSVLDRLPGRKELEARIRAQGSGGFQGNVTRRGDRLPGG